MSDLPQAVERALLRAIEDERVGYGHEFKAVAEGAAALGLYSPPQPPQVVNGYDDLEVRTAAEESGLSEEQARAVVNRLRERQAE